MWANMEITPSLKRLSPRELQSNFHAQLEGKEKGVFLINFRISNIFMGFAQLYVNLLRYGYSNETVVWDGFYPHHTTHGLEGRGIGTLSVISSLDKILESGHASLNHKVFHSPKLTQKYREFLDRPGLNREGLSLKDYYNLAVQYANLKGFCFTKK